MKSCIGEWNNIGALFLSLILLAPVAVRAMDTTKNSMGTMALLKQNEEKIPVINTSTLSERVDEYYKNNDTLLVTRDALANTIKKMQKFEKNDAIEKETKELGRVAQNGAALLWKIANGSEEFIAKLAKTIKNSEVVDIIVYLYLQSCNLRSDDTGFTEGIISLMPGNSYTKNLRTFLKDYWARMSVEEKQKPETARFVRDASTPNAFRLVCTAPKDTSLEERFSFLGRFEGFHITMPQSANESIEKVTEGIRIKPERLLKVGLVNRVKVKLSATPNAGSEFNKETDVPMDLVNKFIKTFPDEVQGKKLTNISKMYEHIQNELTKATGDELRFDLSSCLSTFEKYAIKNNLRHLTHRTGSEIVLNEEELYESWLADLEQAKPVTKEETTTFGIFLVFKALREAVRAYVKANTSASEAAESMRKEIENFHALMSEKGNAIKDQGIREYYTNTALALKYTAELKTEDSKAPATTLAGRLARPLFEKSYQATLNLAEFAEKLALENKVKKSRELAAETDKLLLSKVKEISGKYVGDKKDLTHVYDKELPCETKLGELIKKDDDIKTLTKDQFFKIGRLAANLTDFIQTQHALKKLNQYLVGTAIQVSEIESKWETQKKFISVLGLLKSDVEKMFLDMMNAAENNGYICSASVKGKAAISEVKRPSVLSGQKNPAAIQHMKKIPQFFASKEALKQQVLHIYETAGNLSQK